MCLAPTASTDDEVDLRARRQHPSRPTALRDDDALLALARVGVAHLSGSAMPLCDRPLGGRNPLTDDFRHPARRARDREPARDRGRGVVVRVAGLRGGDRARTGARQVDPRPAGGAVPASREGNRQSGGRCCGDGEVPGAVGLVRERAEGDRLACLRDRERPRDSRRRIEVQATRLRGGDRAETGARDANDRAAERAGTARTEGDWQARGRRCTDDEVRVAECPVCDGPNMIAGS